MNVIEESKEQVPDMVYKNLIESFAKARIEEIKTPIGYYMTIKYLENTVSPQPCELFYCSCEKCTCDDGHSDFDEENKCDWCKSRGDNDDEYCDKCEVPNFGFTCYRTVVYFSKDQRDLKCFMGGRDEPKGDWSDKLKEMLDRCKGEPIKFELTNKSKFSTRKFGHAWQDHKNVKVKQKGRYRWCKVRYWEHVFLEVEKMSPVYE